MLFCNFLQTDVLNELLVKTLDQCLSKHLIKVSSHYYDSIVIITPYKSSYFMFTKIL